MNHRRSLGGYHSLLALGTFGVVLLPACARVALLPPASPVPSSPGEPWRSERTAVVAQINSARAELGFPPLAYDSTLERVGDMHCRILIEERGDGHFSRSGVPPYLRYLLAGGNGFHRENVGSYSTMGRVADSALARILLISVEDMLAEVPPNDGHRRSLLDPWVTHVGVGLAVRGGEVRMTHELATEVTQSWAPPPAAAAPGTALALSGRLARPWQPEVVEVLWEELPRPLSDAQLHAIRAYGYPERR
ncbi:MAG TPA: CAP domain-containing protein, partial [Thermoanaerobaculaceae bacterium]|nr:CAP domain-containing protein [Thermoanaerobaculaceae bacterium]